MGPVAALDTWSLTMDLGINDKVALVTAASQGIGKATALALAPIASASVPHASVAVPVAAASLAMPPYCWQRN